MSRDPIEVRGLSKRFGAFTAVDGVSFAVGRGEIFGLLGPNGAGKSTTIRMLCGLLRPSGGSASVAGHDVASDPGGVRASIGYMSQRFSLYRDLSVIENLAFFGGVYGLDAAGIRRRSEEALTATGLSGLEARAAGTLSGALRQRLALSCAMLHQPAVLFLDEPTSGVDPLARRRFWDLIQRASAAGTTVIVTTHFMDEAEFCGRIGFLSDGRLTALDPPSRLRDGLGEDVFEISVRVGPGVRDRVAAVPGVRAASYFGQRIHVFGAPGAWTAESLTDALRSAGVEVVSARPVRPALEDVFVRLAGRGRGGEELPT